MPTQVNPHYMIPISQELIQRQLQTLYETPLPQPVNGGPRHLIDHRMILHKGYVHGPQDSTDQYLEAFIACPEVELGTVLDAEEAYRKVKVKYRFKRGDDWDLSEEQMNRGENRDSFFMYQYIHKDWKTGTEIAENQKININGWEVSWDTVLSTRLIKDIQEDILEPAAAPYSTVNITEDLRNTLQALNEGNKQISSVYCYMDSGRLVNTFKVLNTSGKRPHGLTDSKGYEIDIDHLIESLADTFHANFIGDEIEAQGIASTPKNPFILGYTVSEHLGAHTTVNSPDDTTTISRSISASLPTQFLVSAGSGVLKYHLTVAGAFGTDVKSPIIPINNVCETIPLMVPSYTFLTQWLGDTFARLFHIPPSYVTGKIAAKLNLANQVDGMVPDDLLKGQNNGPEYKMTYSHKSGRRVLAEEGEERPLKSVVMDYETTLKLSYDNVRPLEGMKHFSERELRLTVNSWSQSNLNTYTRAPNDSQEGEDTWKESSALSIFYEFRYTYHVSIVGGTINVKCIKAEHLKEYGNIVLKNKDIDKENEAEVWTDTKTNDPSHPCPPELEFKFDFDDLAKIFGVKGVWEISKSLERMIEGLGTPIILPGGRAVPVRFEGIWVDDEGHVFVNLTF